MQRKAARNNGFYLRFGRAEAVSLAIAVRLLVFAIREDPVPLFIQQDRVTDFKGKTSWSQTVTSRERQ